MLINQKEAYKSYWRDARMEIQKKIKVNCIWKNSNRYISKAKAIGSNILSSTPTCHTTKQSKSLSVNQLEEVYYIRQKFHSSHYKDNNIINCDL